MAMADRNKARLTPNESSTGFQEVLEKLESIENKLQTVEHDIELMKSHERVHADNLEKTVSHYEEMKQMHHQLAGALSKSEELRANASKEIAATASSLKDTVVKSDQHMRSFMSDRENKLGEALQQVRGLADGITSGFSKVLKQTGTPLKQKLLHTVTVAGFSILGGVVVFLVCFTVWGHTPSTTSSTHTTTPVHKTKSKTK